MRTDSEDKNLRDFLRIAMFSTALGVGVVAASLYSLRKTPSGLGFELTIGSVVAFIIGAAAGWWYWRMVGKLVLASAEGSTERRAKLRIYSAVLIILGIAAFLYPIRFVPPENVREVVAGLGMAFLVLTGVALVLWQIKRFLDRDSES